MQSELPYKSFSGTDQYIQITGLSKTLAYRVVCLHLSGQIPHPQWQKLPPKTTATDRTESDVDADG